MLEKSTPTSPSQEFVDRLLILAPISWSFLAPDFAVW